MKFSKLTVLLLIAVCSLTTLSAMQASDLIKVSGLKRIFEKVWYNSRSADKIILSRRQNLYARAAELYEKARACMGPESLKRLADCYSAVGKETQAINCYKIAATQSQQQKTVKKTTKQASFYSNYDPCVHVEYYKDGAGKNRPTLTKYRPLPESLLESKQEEDFFEQKAKALKNAADCLRKIGNDESVIANLFTQAAETFLSAAREEGKYYSDANPKYLKNAADCYRSVKNEELINEETKKLYQGAAELFLQLGLAAASDNFFYQAECFQGAADCYRAVKIKEELVKKLYLHAASAYQKAEKKTIYLVNQAECLKNAADCYKCLSELSQPSLLNDGIIVGGVLVAMTAVLGTVYGGVKVVKAWWAKKSAKKPAVDLKIVDHDPVI